VCGGDCIGGGYGIVARASFRARFPLTPLNAPPAVSPLPQRRSLVNQTVAFLEAEIARGVWRGCLPGERILAERLQVSRSTLRRALAQLRAKGVVESRQGVGNQIEVRRSSRAARSNRGGRSVGVRDVAIVTPEPLERLRPAQTLWIDELRGMLSERGCRLHVIHGRRYTNGEPGAALEQLIKQHPHACWVLLMTGAGCQQWFARSGLPCIVAGSCHAEAGDLPYRDIDYRAACRHAVGVFLRGGHRQIALLTQEQQLAGDIASEAGFWEAVRASNHEEVDGSVVKHDGSLTGVLRVLKRVLRVKARPSALLVTNPYHALAALSGLGALGWRVPDQVSLISRDDDLFLSFVVPTPARYVVPPVVYARSLLGPVCEMLEGHSVSRRAALLMPEFVSGETVG